MRQRILLIEDDAAIAEQAEHWFTSQNYLIDVCMTGKEGLHKHATENPDVVIVDLGLPDFDGVDIVKEIRSRGSTVPVLVLTGKSDIQDKERALDAGGDDYVTKPFLLRELAARVRALLRRPQVVRPNVLKIGDVELDTAARTARRGGEPIALQPREFAILELLMNNPNRPLSGETIMDRLWHSDSEASVDTVKVHVMKLRSKLDVAGKPQLIETVRKSGYRFVDNESS